jgi:hypothetical protein
MLRIDFVETTVMRMSGRLTEEYRDVVERFVRSHSAPSSLVVDLSEVTYVDRAGEELLQWIGEYGSRFQAGSTYALHICERLHLNISEPTSNTEESKIARNSRRHG